MLTLMLVALVSPFAVLSALDRLIPHLNLAPSVRGRAGLTILLFITGGVHLARAAAVSAMIPAFVPWRVETVLAVGALEILCAIGLWIPHMVRIAGDSLILLIICAMPASIYAALNHVAVGEYAQGPVYLLMRLPFQFFLMWWIYRAALHEER